MYNLSCLQESNNFKKSEITTKSKNKQSKKQQKIEKEFEYYKNIYLRVFKSKEI